MVNESREMLADTAVAILCGGRGTRMGSADRHKVCFPIDGVPAIVRTVKMFHQLGTKKIVIVVGSMANDVISTVSRECPDVIYVCQPQQMGTGHAAQIAASALKNLGHSGPIIITMGDKVIAATVIRAVLEKFLRGRADLVFVSGPKKHAGQVSTAGRIVTDRTGRILANVELRDIQKAQIVASLARLATNRQKGPVNYSQVIRTGLRYINDEKKLLKAIGPVADAVRAAEKMSARDLLKLLGSRPGQIAAAGRFLPAEQIEKQAKTVNLSVYLGRSDFWYRYLPNLENDNAQQEYYLTDVIDLAAVDGDHGCKMAQHKISDPSEVMAFNSPDELLLIEDTLRRRSNGRRPSSVGLVSEAVVALPKPMYQSAGKWLELFQKNALGLKRTLGEVYGTDERLIENRRKLFLKAIRLFVQRFGANRKAIIVRAPGRINLLGRHVDHRGGAVNVMAIDKDVVFVAAARNDDVVTLCNTDPKRFPQREFSLAELLGDIDWQDWLSYINSDHVRAILSRTQGDWSNYAKASLLRLQQRFHDVRILGFDAAVAGDIPMAAGLSSSSALVVAAAEVAVAFNGLDVTPSELVDVCGEGEWFVGSRGGGGDHAAIRMGRRGQIAHVKFFPFQIAKVYNFPENCRIIIAYSGIDARKSAGAKDKFNQKVASYELSFMLAKDRLSQYRHLLEHVRDLNPRRLNCAVSDIYRNLLKVPECMEVERLTELLSERHRERLGRIFASHEVPKAYDLRGVLLYGVAECERSLLAPMLVEQGRIEEFGRLMNISHDGDRLAGFEKTHSGKWRSGSFTYDFSDQALARLCDDLASEDPQRVLGAQLYMQPGSYGCSTVQIDKMIDIVKAMPGVYGAQLGGAGLGGCIMILARPEVVSSVCSALADEYYQPAKLTPLTHVCQPVAGSGLISL